MPTPSTPTTSRQRWIALAIGASSLALALAPGTAANAATTLDGPVPLGTAAPFGVLGASTVINTGPSTVDGDVGLSPGSAVVGFTGPPNGSYTGTLHATDEVAANANADLTTGYRVAAGLAPDATGLSELGGSSLDPGVYSGVNLSLTGEMTLAGTAESVWVFQADESLITATDSNIVLTGGASACNVFWKVGSSATLGTDSDFVGTILADQSISVTTGADVIGRLLARVGAVTLDTNDITVPTDCAPDGDYTESPTVDSSTPPDGTVGTPYEFDIPAEGTPAPSVVVSDGALPPGLTIDDDGTISGTPTAPGDYPFEVVISNGEQPDITVDYVITITPEAVVPSPGPSSPTPGTPGGPGTPGDSSDGLAVTGVDDVAWSAGIWAIVLTAMGGVAMALSSRMRRANGRG